MCTHTINMFALKVKLAGIMNANPHERKNATSMSQASPPSCSVRGLSGGTCQRCTRSHEDVGMPAEQGRSSEQVTLPLRLLFPSSGLWSMEEYCSFLRTGLF